MATGENVSGEAGLIPIDFNISPSDFLNFDDVLNNLGASTSSANSSSNVGLTFGDVNIASGKSSAGNLGTVKSLGLAVFALGAFLLFQVLSKKR